MFEESVLYQMIKEDKFLAGPTVYVNALEYREFLLADSGYNQCSFLVTPIDLVGRPYGLTPEESYYNYRVSRVRCRVEIAIGALKNRF